MNSFSEKVEPANFMFIRVPRTEIESGDINPTLWQLNRLRTDKASAQKYRSALSFDIVGYEEIPKELIEIRDVQNFMAKLDKEFPYWFYFLPKIDDSLKFILFSVCPHYRESAGGEWRVQQERFMKFMSEHHAALEEMFDLAEISDEERQWTRDEINTYFDRANNLWP